MVPGIVYSGSWTILLDELEMYQFFATLSNVIGHLCVLCTLFKSSGAQDCIWLTFHIIFSVLGKCIFKIDYTRNLSPLSLPENNCVR